MYTLFKLRFQTKLANPNRNGFIDYQVLKSIKKFYSSFEFLEKCEK